MLIYQANAADEQNEKIPRGEFRIGKFYESTVY